MNPFAFQLGQVVKISCSGETGTVVSRAEHQTAEPNYLVHYAAKDGTATERWWSQSTLEAA